MSRLRSERTPDGSMDRDNTYTGRSARLRAVAAALASATMLLSACASIRPLGQVIGEVRDVPEAGGPNVGDPGGDGAAPNEAPALEAGATQPTRAELLTLSDTRIEALDTRCRALVETASAPGALFDDLMAASRALVFAADLRIQKDVAFRFDLANLPEPDELIAAEDDVPADLKADIRSLAKSSRDLAQRALELQPDDPGARLFSTLGQGLFLWSLGPIQALANGAGSLPSRVTKLAKDHPNFEGASPLRLKGRFQTRAPWPYKDTSGGVDTLTSAVEVAPIPLNLLFLGDAQWLVGDEDAAKQTWRAASRAKSDFETSLAAPLLREIARMRIAAAGR